MENPYRLLILDGSPIVPGVSISLLEYCLGEERCFIDELAQRPFEERWKDIKDRITTGGLVSTLFEECAYYPLLFTVYKIL